MESDATSVHLLQARGGGGGRTAMWGIFCTSKGSLVRWGVLEELTLRSLMRGGGAVLGGVLVVPPGLASTVAHCGWSCCLRAGRATSLSRICCNLASLTAIS